MTIRRMTKARFVAWAGLLLAAGCATATVIDRSNEYLAEGYVQQAFEELDAERRRQTADGGEASADLVAEWERVAYLHRLEQGRQAIYADREQRGIDFLHEALLLRPNDEMALGLITRAKRKMAVRSVTEGQDHLAKSELDRALASFIEALQHVPGYRPAEDGKEQVRAAVTRLHSEAQKQFIEAIRKLPEFRFSEVDWHTAAALTRDPSRDDAHELKEKAKRELAESARLRAEESQEAKVYGAALMEFKTARALWPEMPGIDDSVKQMSREVEAMWKIESAQLAIRANRLEDARRMLEDAFELSTLERTAINELRLDIRRRGARTAYDAARDLELQGLKAEALAAFEALSKDWPDGLLDEQTRIGALRSDIDSEKAYAQGEEQEKAGDLPAALESFKTAQTYYARLRDVGARIDRITAELQKRGTGGS
jgi:tetratricopeptide (TPR) repeat protein